MLTLKLKERNLTSIASDQQGYRPATVTTWVVTAEEKSEGGEKGKERRESKEKRGEEGK